MADPSDHRTSQRTIDGPSEEHHDYFDFFGGDDANGYQPSSLPQNTTASSSNPQRTNSQRSVGLQTDPSSFPDSRDSKKKKKKQSLSKNLASLASRNSFSLRHDAQYSDAPRRVGSISSTSEMTEVPSARPLSAASRFSTPRPQSTFVGASAPSHPYGMYSQNTSLNRQSTMSSYHPSSNRSHNGSQGPTHPYGMYPQSTDNSSETDPLQSSTDIASVGFPGLRQSYARRLGPEGEEADDIIGPDGYTEQLPPYTRYPAGRDAEPIPSKQRSPSAAVPGARISHLSMDMPQTATSATSMTAPLLPNMAPVDGTSDSFVSDTGNQGTSRRERLATKSRKRTCFGHLPLWAVVLMIALLVIVAALLGALIGHYFPGGHDKSNKSVHNSSMPPPPPPLPASVITTTLYDAAPLQTTASDIPPAPTGSFALIMGATDESSTSCLPNTQNQAWQCAAGIMLNMDVSNPQLQTAQISITTNNNSMMGHGPVFATPPSFNGSTSLMLANDTNSPQNGPALFFYQFFNKVVTLPYQDIPFNSSRPTKRSPISLTEMLFDLVERGDHNDSDPDQDPGSDQGQPDPRDMFWVCNWPNTTLEGFIYVEQNATASYNDTAEANSLAPTPAPSATPTPNQKRDDHHHHHHHHFQDEDEDKGKSNWPPNLPPFYPRIVKLQERRDPNHKGQASCQLMVAQQNNTFTPPPGGPININLTEIDVPTNEEAVFSHDRRRNLEAREMMLQERQSIPNFCHCQWVSQ